MTQSEMEALAEAFMERQRRQIEDDLSRLSRLSSAELHERNRRRAEDAFRQRDNLEQMVCDTRERLEGLRRKATDAEARGGDPQARLLWREHDAYAKTLASLEESLRQADETCVMVREALERMEELLRRRAAEASPGQSSTP